MIGHVSIHWGVILGLTIPGATFLGSAVEALRRQIKGWREDDARAMGQLAGLIGDWMDETEEHLDAQDHALAAQSLRLREAERHAGLTPGPSYAPPRSRKAPRRIRAAEAGFDALGETG